MGLWRTPVSLQKGTLSLHAVSRPLLNVKALHASPNLQFVSVPTSLTSRRLEGCAVLPPTALCSASLSMHLASHASV